MFRTRLFHPGQSKILPPGMRGWILPPWFRDQNNPFKGCYTAGQTGFYNYANRSWTSLRADPKGDLIRVDGFGIIELVKPGISIEVWIYHETKVYRPGTYLQLNRNFSAVSGIMDLNFDFGAGSLPVKIGPMMVSDNFLLGMEIGDPRMRQSSLETGAEVSAQSFEPLMVWLVIRPYGSDGLSPIWRMEFKDGHFLANRRKILRFSEEPLYCFFTNTARGDVTQFFRLWEGNSKIEATDGSCTGMIGFAAVPDRWRTVKISFRDMKEHGFWPEASKNHWFPGFLSRSFRPVASFMEITPAKLQTGTRLDQLYPAGIRHLNTFYREKPYSIYQIMIYNRLGLFPKSMELLKFALRKVCWDGRLAERFIGGEYIIVAVADCYKMTGNRVLIETYWPVLKRVGYWLCYQSGLLRAQVKPSQNSDPGRLERMLWLCGSLRAITELGMELDKNREVQFFKNYHLMIWAEFLDGLAATGNKRISFEPNRILESGPEMALSSLQASFPLQLTEKGTPWVRDLIRRICRHHLWRGGFISPQDFQGVNLELTARLGQVLIREGLDYGDVLDFLLDAAGPAFSWPDRINPLSWEGIGAEGHDPKVLYQMLLLIRSLFFHEEQEDLHLLPGVFISRFWRAPNLELTGWPTHFGTVSVKVRTIGGVSQIDFKPTFRRQPQKILLTFDGEYRLLYTDTKIQRNGKTLILNPDFHVLRVSNNACLDNTFRHTL